jgi:hypothetical protein
MVLSKIYIVDMPYYYQYIITFLEISDTDAPI